MINKINQQLKTYGLFGLIWNYIWEIQMRLKWFFLKSYSQGNEDILIDKLLNRKRKGFYVDIGAYDPTRFSNTKRFYLRGWKGINIEPNPINAAKFNKFRPKDINLTIGVANKNGLLDFFEFDPKTLSTFSKTTAKKYQKQGFKLKKTIKIKVQKLGDVLKNKATEHIDFFNIDTEGFDLQVLKSNNWDNFKPTVICIESSQKGIDNMLSKLGYRKIYQTYINSIYYYGKF